MFDYRDPSGRRMFWGRRVPGRWPGLREGGPLGLRVEGTDEQSRLTVVEGKEGIVSPFQGSQI